MWQEDNGGADLMSRRAAHFSIADNPCKCATYVVVTGFCNFPWSRIIWPGPLYPMGWLEICTDAHSQRNIHAVHPHVGLKARLITSNPALTGQLASPSKLIATDYSPGPKPGSINHHPHHREWPANKLLRIRQYDFPKADVFYGLMEVSKRDGFQQ